MIKQKCNMKIQIRNQQVMIYKNNWVNLILIPKLNLKILIILIWTILWILWITKTKKINFQPKFHKQNLKLFYKLIISNSKIKVLKNRINLSNCFIKQCIIIMIIDNCIIVIQKW